MSPPRRYGPAVRRAVARRMAASPREHQEQVALMQMIRFHLPSVWQHTTAVPHGGYRPIRTAVDLKAEGVRKGYPDVVIDLPRGPFHGLRVELKRRDGVPSHVKAEQRTWGRVLNEEGYLAVVGWGAEHAFDQVQRYVALGAPHWRASPEVVAEALEGFCLLGEEIEGRGKRAEAAE